MTENNSAVTLDTLRTEISDVKAGLIKIESQLDQMDRRLDTLTLAAHDNTRDLAHVQNSVNWGIGTLAIVVALVGFTITLAPMFREIAKERRENKQNDEHIRELIREELAHINAGE